MIIQNLKDHQKENQDDHQIFNQLIMLDHTKNPTPTAKATAKTNQTATPTAKAKTKANTRRLQHDTDLINTIDRDFCENINLTTIRDQFNKRGFRTYKTANGKIMNKPGYLEELFKMINERRWIINFKATLIH